MAINEPFCERLTHCPDDGGSKHIWNIRQFLHGYNTPEEMFWIYTGSRQGPGRAIVNMVMNKNGTISWLLSDYKRLKNDSVRPTSQYYCHPQVSLLQAYKAPTYKSEALIL
jgi:hypothetical protein